MTWVDQVILVEFIITSLASVVFVAVYLPVKWFRSAEGIIIMGLHVVVVGFLALGLLRLGFGDHYAARDPLRLFFCSLMTVDMWGMVAVLVRARLRGRRASLAERKGLRGGVAEGELGEDVTG